MPLKVAPQALERAQSTVCAMQVLEGVAESIAGACESAAPHETVLARVAADGSLAGLFTVATTDAQVWIERFEDGGWVLTFRAGTGVEAVQEQCRRVEGLARRRLTVMERGTSAW